MLSKLSQAAQRFRVRTIEYNLNRYQRLLADVDRSTGEIQRYSDDRLRATAGELRQQLSDGADPDAMLANVFALVRETADRVLTLRPYDEQLIAGVALHQGKVVQMQTGEGKTLAAVAPAVLNGLSGRGVHILTYNDYLAERDAGWMGPVFEFLGMTVGHIRQGMTVAERQAAYRCDVTYVTAQEAGFDFLRDQLQLQSGEQVHRPFHYAIIDEADSMLIDESRFPLVIAGDVEEEPVDPTVLVGIIRELTQGIHYEIGDRNRNVNLTADGLDYLEDVLGCGDLHDEQQLPVLTRLNQALHAEHLLRRDIDYIVRDGRVLLLDELNGRVARDRRWPYGLQAAVEAKEGQAIQPDGKVLNSINLQHFVAMYEKLAGMTGTAEEAADELHDFYDMKVAVIPTHRPSIRIDDPDQVYATRDAKLTALVDTIDEIHRTGQPVLVGTASVRESEQLVERLDALQIPYQLLNAKNDHAEAAVIAEAGVFAAVTISTNMAGRGTDIKLGWPDEHDRDRIVSLGGLFVIGTNRHESRRIDNQLRGRAGRQGDPGRTRFIISVKDDLLQRFGIADILKEISLDRESTDCVDDRNVTKRVAHIQRVVEGEFFEIRRTLRKYSGVMESQRKAIARRRQQLLANESPEYVLPDRSPERYHSLVARFGEETVQRVERQITLYEILRGWSDHLAEMATLRESVYLWSLTGHDPLYEFQREARKSFLAMQRRIDDAVVDRFETVEITEDGIDLEREGLLGPSSTWTYMINDHPAGDLIQRIAKAIVRKLQSS